MKGSGAFAAFAHREFTFLFLGLIAANLGSWMQQFALGWFVVQLAVADGNPQLGAFYLGLVGLARAAPAFVLGLAGGVLADRSDRRLMLAYTRVAAAVIALLLAAVTLSGTATIGAIMVLAFLSAADLAFDGPVRQALVANTVPRDDLFSAIGLSRGAMQAATLVGPVCAGFLIVPFGVGGVMIAVAILYVLALLALVPMSPHPVVLTRRTSAFESLVEGLTYVRRDPMVGPLTAIIVAFALFYTSYVQLLPAVAHDVLRVGPVELSYLTSGSAVGALVGTYLTAASGQTQRPGVMLLLFMAIGGGLLVVFGLQRELVPAIAVLALLGVATTVCAGNHQAMLQTYLPNEMRGRAMGMTTTIFASLNPLGTLMLGSLGTFIGVSNAILVSGVAAAASALLTLAANRTLREARLGSAPPPSATASDADADPPSRTA